MDFTEQPILTLQVEDAGELLTLQRAAYVTEAQAHDDAHLPPLLETLDEVRADLRSDTTTVLGIRDGGRLVATVRVRHDPADEGMAEIARLAVAPDRQGEGLGTRLLVAAEQHVPPEATALTLFTGARWEFRTGRVENGQLALRRIVNWPNPRSPLKAGKHRTRIEGWAASLPARRRDANWRYVQPSIGPLHDHLSRPETQNRH